MKLFLQKQDKNIEKNKAAGNDRLPYFRLVLVPEEEGGEWKEIGALWKAKSGKGYSGKTAENVDILIKELPPLSDEEKAKIKAAREAEIGKGTDGISAEDINLD